MSLSSPRPMSRAAIRYLVQRARGDSGPVLIQGDIWIQRGSGRRARILDFRAPGIAYVFRDSRIWTSTRAEFLAGFDEAP